MLGVVEENHSAIQFWSNNSFTVIRKTEPRKFGKKMQAVFVMRRDVDLGPHQL
jgi:hypothetical protein